MLRSVILAAGLALVPMVAMGQTQPDGLRDPRFRPYALSNDPAAFVYDLPVSFGSSLPQLRLVPSELPDDDGGIGDHHANAGGDRHLSGPPRMRRIIDTIE